MSIIGKKPYINTIIDELISDTNSGKDALNSLSNLLNVANSTETTPIDFTNPLEKIYNYAELKNMCSVTYTSFKLYEGTVKKGFLIVTPLHTALFAFGKNEENMECYDLTWTKYERSYCSIDESLDANEFRREITLQGSSDLYNKISSVSVSSTGTATDEVSYITVDGVEKKIGGGGTKLYRHYVSAGSYYGLTFISTDSRNLYSDLNKISLYDYFSAIANNKMLVRLVDLTDYNEFPSNSAVIIQNNYGNVLVYHKTNGELKWTSLSSQSCTSDTVTEL